MKAFIQSTIKITKKLVFISVPAVLMLGADQAKAVLNVNIFDDGPNLKISVSGSLSQLPAVVGSASCGYNGALLGEFQTSYPGYSNALCSGLDTTFNYSDITGPSGYGGTGALLGATSVSGSIFFFSSSAYTATITYQEIIGLDPGYIINTPYVSEAIFNGRSLASEGFTASGFVGSWTLDGTSESINLFIGPPAEVPGPLPLLGAGAAFGWTRRLRRRIASPLITPHK